MNLPNALSLFRLLLVPVYLKVFFSGVPNAGLYAAAIFVLAGVTDIVDGYIARKYNLITLLGRILDPLADKMMVTTALCSLSIAGKLPWAITALYIAKEALMLIGSAVLYKRLKDMPASNKWGKSATVLLYIAIIGTILLPLPEVVKKVLFGLCYIAVFGALYVYVTQGVRLLKENKK